MVPPSSDSGNEYYRSNPSILLSPAIPIQQPESTSGLEASGSLHSLLTLAGVGQGYSQSFERDTELEAEHAGGTRGAGNKNAEFVVVVGADRGGGATAPNTPTRARALTFGGVPIPTPSSSSTGTSRVVPLNSPTASPSNTPDSTPPTSRRPSLLPSGSPSGSVLHLGGGCFSERRPGLAAALKALSLLLISLLGLSLLLSAMLPPISESDWKLINKIPRSFDDLKSLNAVLQVYKDQNYWRVMGSFSVVYLFLQAFSIPGSMYLSILAGAMFGIVIALPLVCTCVATGALLCYLISAALGPALLMHSEKWSARLDNYRGVIDAQGANLMSYLIILRIAPLPPHWVVNVVAPHLGISIWTFWSSTFIGIIGVSYIHTSIGTALDQMTSSDDFHLISLKNFLGLAGIVAAVLVPVLLRASWKKELSDAAAVDGSLDPSLSPDNSGDESFSESEQLLSASDRTTKPAQAQESPTPKRFVPFSDEERALDALDPYSRPGTSAVGGKKRSDGLDKARKILGVNLPDLNR